METKKMEVHIYKGWSITETPCFPCMWKIEHIDYKSDNHTWRYHSSIKE